MAGTANPPPPATELPCVTALAPRTEAEFQTVGLCTHCRVLQLDDIAADQISASQKYELRYERHDTFPGLPQIAQSAASGCGVCRALHAKITDALDDSDYSGPVKIDRLVVAFYENQLDFIIETPSWTTGITFYIAADPGLRGAEKLGISQQHVPEDLLSDAGISNLRNFIDQAVEWSPLPSEVAALPTRLLDVGGRPEQQDPRLVVSSEHPPLRDSAPTDVEARRYIALSYCWGTQHGAPLLRTERATLPSFAKGIPLSLFPPALRDAVLVTRRVGSGEGGSVRYLWIDALCIVQDDRRDWEREAARMAGVYRNAYLTFCSTQASCALGFARRPASSAIVPLSPRLAPLGLRGSYHLTEYMDETFAWEARAWTFQELFFSARAVLFGRVQTYLWDTRSARAADPDGGYARGAGVFQPESRRRWWESQVRAGMSWSWQLEDADDKAAAAVDPYEDWYAKVAAYSQRSLTFAADRLPAISALAAHTADTLVQQRGDATYAAGLWAADLLRGLLWSITAFDTDPAPSLAEYVAQRTDAARRVAPSWSWACQGEAVCFPAAGGAGFAPLGAVEAVVDVRPAGLDAYGQVDPACGGRVVLSGWMARVPYAYFEIHHTPPSSGQYDAVRRDASDRSGVNSLRLFSTGGGGGEADVAFDWWVEDERHAEYWPGGSFTVLLTGLSVYPPELASSSSSTSAEKDNWELFRTVADLDTEPGRREVRRPHDGEVVTYDSIFVLGLVLRETERPGVFLRAGYMRGSAFEDTLAELKAAEWRTVEIV
ncbi:hypothetical protein SLS58_010922 [Diplodia intermedia]|uniref:Heterokaryon incompatibility domain-containing protein n=1 Tax=Diplodia intermedia TaxID=856260 RepID=A0ABR3T3H8_9PEZI